MTVAWQFTVLTYWPIIIDLILGGIERNIRRKYWEPTKGGVKNEKIIYTLFY